MLKEVLFFACVITICVAATINTPELPEVLSTKFEVDNETPSLGERVKRQGGYGGYGHRGGGGYGGYGGGGYGGGGYGGGGGHHHHHHGHGGGGYGGYGG